MKTRVSSIFNTAVHRRINAGLAAFALAGGMLIAGCSDKQDTTPPPAPPVPTAPQKPDDVAQEPQLPGDAIQKAREIFGRMPDSSRDLTTGETKLLHGIFGDALDLTGVRIHFYNKPYKNYAATVIDGDGKNMYVFTSKYRSKDYSEEKDGFLFGSLVYEATELWSQQTKKAISKGDYDGGNYNLSSDLSFKDYSPALQASIMNDYARRFLHAGHQGQWLAQTYGTDNCDADDFLSRIVERQFPAAAAARQAMIKVQPLTDNEKGLVQAVFGKEIDTSVIRKHFNPWRCSVIKGPGRILATVANTRDINFYGAENFSDDYARDKDVGNFGAFMHEVTHIWQYQTQWRNTNYRFVNEGNEYNYPVDTKRWTFGNYGIEQQAAIVQDYVRTFVRREHKPAWIESDENSLQQVKTLVEDRFPEARKLRAYFEQHKTVPDLQDVRAMQSPPSAPVAQQARSPAQNP